VAARPSLSSRLAILAVFYIVQGLPFGFQATALPVYLTASGLSLTKVGFAGALSAPWLLKPLWAPLVDRWHSDRFGRRRTWIVPLQAALASTCFAAAFVPSESLGLLLGLIALTNLFAATMDIAVDGLAIDLLEVDELGWGNIAQVVGYKLGMLLGGGVLVWASQWIGWHGLFLVITGLITIALLITLSWREPVRERTPDESAPGRARLAELLSTLGRALARPGGLALLAVAATYKIGESMNDAMFEPFLVRAAGWDAPQVGLIVGTWGMAFSLAGSFLGGALAVRLGVARALVLFAVLRTLSLAGVLWLSGQVGPLGPIDPDGFVRAVVAVKGFEEIAGGGLTTAMFAFMMSRVDRRIGATHYTLIAGVEVLGKVPGGLSSGVLVDAFGFSWTFAIGLALGVAFLPLLMLLRARPEPIVA
jgi:PAT family beta-lactamase induction signal transducer AmpG